MSYDGIYIKSDTPYVFLREGKHVFYPRRVRGTSVLSLRSTDLRGANVFFFLLWGKSFVGLMCDEEFIAYLMTSSKEHPIALDGEHMRMFFDISEKEVARARVTRLITKGYLQICDGMRMYINKNTTIISVGTKVRNINRLHMMQKDVSYLVAPHNVHYIEKKRVVENLPGTKEKEAEIDTLLIILDQLHYNTRTKLTREASAQISIHERDGNIYAQTTRALSEDDCLICVDES